MANIRAQGQLILQDENLAIHHKGASTNGKAKSFKEARKKGAGGLGHPKALNDITNSSRLRQETSSKKNNRVKEFNIAKEMCLHDHRKCTEARTAAMDHYRMDRFFLDHKIVSPVTSPKSKSSKGKLYEWKRRRRKHAFARTVILLCVGSSFLINPSFDSAASVGQILQCLVYFAEEDLLSSDGHGLDIIHLWFLFSSNPISQIQLFKLPKQTISNRRLPHKLMWVLPESTLKTSKWFALKTTTKEDSVLALFNNYEFTQPQISHIIASNPQVLGIDPDKILKPKFELLCNIGISGSNLAKILSRYSNFLTSSLERELIPALEFLRSFVHTDERLAVTLSCLCRTIRLLELMTPNIEILRDHGVAESHISGLMFRQPRLLISKAERFKEMVLRTKEMGLDLSSSKFVYGLIVLCGVKKPAWEAKLAVFSSFGWSEDEILSLFRKEPSIFGLSENRIRARLDFFMNKLNWTIAYISKYLATLGYSMEKRIFPRSSVFQVLLLKGLMKNESVGAAMKLTEDKFLKKYVLRYLDEQPHLLKLYQSKTLDVL